MSAKDAARKKKKAEELKRVRARLEAKKEEAPALPMTGEEFTEMAELLASIDEDFYPMDASEADGLMTAVQLLPRPPENKEWIALVFSTDEKEGTTGDVQTDKRLRALLLKRFKEIGQNLKDSVPLDPLYFDLEHEDGTPVEGKEAIECLEPFALGFLEGAQLWPGILNTDSAVIGDALHGILRHLPEDALGDFAPVKETLDKEVPLEDLPAALSDMTTCLAEIATVTKGYPMPELCENPEAEE